MSALESLPPESARSAVASYLQRLPEAPWSPEVARRLLEHVRAAPPRKSGQRRTAWVRLALAACLVLVLLQPDLRPYSGYTTPPPAQRARDQMRIRVQALDRELQVALQRGESAAQLAALWAERNAVAAQLSSSTPASPVRI